MNDTKIEWADDTVNPWWGCVRVSPACEHCYAETLDKRVGGHHWGVSALRRLRVEKAIGEMKKIERRAEKEGRPRRVFIASMSDVFEDRADLVEPRARLWEALHALSGWVVPMLLTKRPAVMAAWAAAHGWPKHAWAGTTVEDQRRHDERADDLRRVPARVRFFSMDPLLGPVDVSQSIGNAFCMSCRAGAILDHTTAEPPADTSEWVDPDCAWACRKCGGEIDGRYDDERIHWVIAGGESGPKARPSHPDWFRSLRDQCEAAGVPFHFKQWGEWVPRGPESLSPNYVCVDNAPRVRLTVCGCNSSSDIDGPGGVPGGGKRHRDCDYSRDSWMNRVGKKAAGRLLDGRTHDDFPAVEVP